MCLNDGIRWSTHDFENECRHPNDDFYARLNKQDEIREEQKRRDEFRARDKRFEDFWRNFSWDTPNDNEPVSPVSEPRGDIFGLKRSKSQEELRKLYRKQCLKHHPDKGGKQSDFVLLQKEYDRLKMRFSEIK